MEIFPAFASALVLGLLGSMHCIGMCSGLQVLLNKPQVIRTPTENQYHLAVMNLGRVTLYSLIGAVFGFIGAEIGSQFNVPGWSVLLRQLAAIMIIIVGFQLVLQVEKPLAFLEKAGYRLWQRIQPLFNKQGTAFTYGHTFRRGMLWGFLPCGLVYSVLAIAVVSGSATGGFVTMLGFGLGTLPAMLLTGYVLWRFKQLLQWRLLRRGGGVFFILLGVLMLAPTLMHHGNHQHGGAAQVNNSKHMDHSTHRDHSKHMGHE